MPNVEIKTSTECLEINLSPGSTEIKVYEKCVKKAYSFNSDHIISALPATSLKDLINISYLKDSLSKISAVDVAVVNVCFKGRDILPISGFGYLVPSNSGSKILGTIFDSCAVPEQDEGLDITRVTVMLGGHKFHQLFGDPGKVPKELMLNVALESIRENLGISPQPMGTLVSIHKKCIPQYNVGHQEILNNVHDFTLHENLPISFIGSSYQGVSVNDCVMYSKKVVESLEKKIKELNTEEFEKPDFNVITFVNNILCQPETQIYSESSSTDKFDKNVNSLESKATQKLLNLQLLSGELSQNLDLLSEQTQKNLPRVLIDLDQIKNHTKNLINFLEATRINLEKNEKDKSCFETLFNLDKVKSRMEKSRDSLKEAENWNSLNSEMENIFKTTEYEKAAKRLGEAQRSLHLLINAPDYQDKKTLLSKLLNQFESSISPQLVKSLNEHDTENVKQFYNSFLQIGRGNEFTQFYHRSRKFKFIKLWSSFEEDPSIKNLDINNEKAIIDWMSKFFDELFMMLNKEFNWTANVFTNSKEVLIELIQQIFNSLKPSLSTRIDDVIQKLGDQHVLPLIIKIYLKSLEFGLKIENLFRQSFEKNQLSQQYEESLESLAPTSNLHLNNSTLNALIIEGGSWGHIIFQEFISFQQSYGKLEEKFLLFQSNSLLKFDRKVDNLELGKIMLDSLIPLFKHAEAALTRCEQFTNGYGAAGLVDALDNFWKSVLNRFSQILMIISTESGVNNLPKPSKSPKNIIKAGISPSRSSSNSSLQNYLQEADDEMEDSFISNGNLGQDWTNFQVGLRILGVCLTFSKKLSAFDLELKKFISLVNTEENNLNSLKQGRMCHSSLSLLTSSTLNSFKLHTLTESISDKGLEKKDLENFNNNASNGLEYCLLKNSVRNLRIFISNAQKFVFDTLFFYINNYLQLIPTMEVWASEQNKIVSSFGLTIPQFSLSPSAFITRIGEHLLTLPQQLELYTDDEALGFSCHTLPYLEKDDLELIEEEEVWHLWLISISRGTMLKLVEKVLLIKTLSVIGIKQLKTDLNYIINIFEKAMDIEINLQLKKLLFFLELENEILLEADFVNSNKLVGWEIDIFEKVRDMRK
ncbi:hypothetical protein HDU92_001756 [Lobulomyces angularis]|nr:hypothetical protein HDU92_001756 [Lobulomyces angularis]